MQHCREQTQETIRAQNSYGEIREHVRLDPDVAFWIYPHGVGTCQWVDEKSVIRATFEGTFHQGSPVTGRLTYHGTYGTTSDVKDNVCGVKHCVYEGSFRDGYEYGIGATITWPDKAVGGTIIAPNGNVTSVKQRFSGSTLLFQNNKLRGFPPVFEK